MTTIADLERHIGDVAFVGEVSRMVESGSGRHGKGMSMYGMVNLSVSVYNRIQSNNERIQNAYHGGVTMI